MTGQGGVAAGGSSQRPGSDDRPGSDRPGHQDRPPHRLSGRGRVLLIRPDGNDRDALALAAQGLTTWVDPYLRTTACADPTGAEELLNGIGAIRPATPRTTWLIATSPRAYPAWSMLVGPARLEAAVASAAASGLRACAVGAATARSLPKPAWPPPLVPQIPTVAGLVTELSRIAPGLAIAPQSAIAGPELAERLLSLGWDVLARAVYETVVVPERPSSADSVEGGHVAAVVLRSPSAVEALLHHSTPAAGVRLIAAGPTTARALAIHGLACVQAIGPSPREVAAACALSLAG